MAKIAVNPKNRKHCVFCEYWMGDADLEYVSNMAGYRFEANAKGKCTKYGGNTKTAITSGCRYFEYNREAKKLL